MSTYAPTPRTTPYLVDDPAGKDAALHALVEAVARGRSEGSRPPSRKELAATAVLRLPLEEVSAKRRSGPPVDEPEHLDLPHWAGLLPLSTVAGAPVPAPDLPADRPVPGHVAQWTPPVSRP